MSKSRCRIKVDDTNTLVTVLGGSVEVSTPDGTQSIVLNEGYSLRATDAGLGIPYPIGSAEPWLVVEWLSPATREGFVLRHGRTLPLKFRLLDSNGDLCEYAQEGIYLEIEGIARWDLGEGGDALRFDEEEFHYIANLHTRDYDLTGEVTVDVWDTDDNILGSIKFEVR